jgi:hypothetical protein
MRFVLDDISTGGEDVGTKGRLFCPLVPRFDRALVRFAFDVGKASLRVVRCGRQSFLSLGYSQYSMATLTKSHPVSPDSNLISLSSSIPTPFSSTDRAYIYRSSHSSHHPITPKPLAHEHPPHTQESQALEEALLNVDRESPAATQVSTSLCLLRVTYGTFPPGSRCHAFDSTRPSLCSNHPQRPPLSILLTHTATLSRPRPCTICSCAIRFFVPGRAIYFYHLNHAFAGPCCFSTPLRVL